MSQKAMTRNKFVSMIVILITLSSAAGIGFGYLIAIRTLQPITLPPNSEPEESQLVFNVLSCIEIVVGISYMSSAPDATPDLWNESYHDLIEHGIYSYDWMIFGASMTYNDRVTFPYFNSTFYFACISDNFNDTDAVIFVYAMFVQGLGFDDDDIELLFIIDNISSFSVGDSFSWFVENAYGMYFVLLAKEEVL